MKRVLLTGANGLLGQKLVSLLAGRDDLLLFASSRGENRNPLQKGYTYLPLDIEADADVLSAFDRYQFSDVIHAAAMTNVDACEKEKEACRRINVEAVRNLVRCCESHSARLIHVSTDFIFDGAAGPYDENAAPHPLSWYGQSKWDAEQIVMAGSMPWAIVRTVLIYGVSEDMSRSNIVLWAKGALEKGQTVKVVNDQFRTPTLAEDLAEGIRLVLLMNKTGVFNISGQENLCIIDLVRRIAKFWGLDESLIQETDSASLAQAAKRPPKTGFIIDKAKRELGYHPHSLEEGLARVDAQLKAR